MAWEKILSKKLRSLVREHIVVFGHASGQIDPFSPNLLRTKAITVRGGT